jgi:hypothetical protein
MTDYLIAIPLALTLAGLVYNTWRNYDIDN